MMIGYMRVSKSDGTQIMDLQRDALLAANVFQEHLYEDFASGKTDDRPGLAACLKALRKGDTLIVWKLDRLGRNLRHLVNTVHELSEKAISFKVLTGQGGANRHHNSARQIGFWHFCIIGRVRKGFDFRTNQSRFSFRPCSGQERRSPLQNDPGETAPGNGLNGKSVNCDQRFV